MNAKVRRVTGGVRMKGNGHYLLIKANRTFLYLQRHEKGRKVLTDDYRTGFISIFVSFIE